MTVLVRGVIHAKWSALKAETTPDGDDVQEHLGSPLGVETPIPARNGGGSVQLFRRGLIVARGDGGGVFVVYGAIYDHYAATRGPEGDLGLPTADEAAAGRGGRVAHFDHGDIYWREDVGAWEVRGSSRRRHAARGYPFAPTWGERGAALLRRLARGLRRYRRRPGERAPSG